jgi:uncharacterized protein YjiS (DUF1127 family)
MLIRHKHLSEEKQMSAYILPVAKFIELSVISRAVHKVSNFISVLADKHAKYKEQKETFKTLQSLSNRELNDIGISRGDIRSIANDTWVEKNNRDTFPIATNSNLKGSV